MKKSAILIFVLGALASGAQAENLAGNYSANDMSVSLSQLYPGTVKALSAATDKSREEVAQDYQRSRLAGTSAQYSALGGYMLKSAFPGVIQEPKLAGKTREEVQAEYQASRPAHTPAAYSSLDDYQLTQAYPGTTVGGNPAVTMPATVAGQASRSSGR